MNLDIKFFKFVENVAVWRVFTTIMRIFFNENMLIDWKLFPFLVIPILILKPPMGIHGDFWDKVIQLRPYLPNIHIMVD